MKKLIITIFVFGLMYGNTHAADFSPGNLLISTNNRIYEFTAQGDYVQDFITEYPGGYPATEYARDVAADIGGNAYIYNGTFYPYMSTYNSPSSSWSHITYSGLSTVNNASYGGIDVYGNTVFVSDMSTSSGGGAQGIVAFNTVTGQAQRFAEDHEPIDLTMGLDGLLYTLSPGGSPGGRTINIYDPSSLTYINSIDLTNIFGWTEHRSIAVDYNGDIFIADWDGEVHHISKAGELIDTITPLCDWIGFAIHCEFIDIDISQSGEIALGTRFGEIFLTDTAFSIISTFDIGANNTFVEFLPTSVPELSVDIDIKPANDSNRINLNSKGVIPVAILTTENFDATTVDPLSVTFGPSEAFATNGKYNIKDVDGDGDLDLVLSFCVQETGILCGNKTALLRGETFSGQAIRGFDFIDTAKCE